jgi:hypothetical protein
VIHPQYKGLQLGCYTIKQMEKQAIKNSIFLLRLDCNAANTALCLYDLNRDFTKVGGKQRVLFLNNLDEKRLK